MATAASIPCISCASWLVKNMVSSLDTFRLVTALKCCAARLESELNRQMLMILKAWHLSEGDLYTVCMSCETRENRLH